MNQPFSGGGFLSFPPIHHGDFILRVFFIYLRGLPYQRSDTTQRSRDRGCISYTRQTEYYISLSIFITLQNWSTYIHTSTYRTVTTAEKITTLNSCFRNITIWSIQSQNTPFYRIQINQETSFDFLPTQSNVFMQSERRHDDVLALYFILYTSNQCTGLNIK